MQKLSANELIREAEVTLAGIRALADGSTAGPLTDPVILARAVTDGILDAPHLKNNPFEHVEIATRIGQRGACVAVCAETGRDLTEEARLARCGLYP